MDRSGPIPLISARPALTVKSIPLSAACTRRPGRSMLKRCHIGEYACHVQAELPLTNVGGAAHTATWLPLYARLGDQIKGDDLGELRVALWLGPHGEHGRLNGGECAAYCTGRADTANRACACA